VELWNVPIIYSMVLTTHILTRDNMDRPTEIGLPTFYRSSWVGGPYWDSHSLARTDSLDFKAANSTKRP